MTMVIIHINRKANIENMQRFKIMREFMTVGENARCF